MADKEKTYVNPMLRRRKEREDAVALDLPRVIGIVGRSYCGSTLLSRLLALVPNAFSCGEVFWLWREPERLGLCTVHGQDCSVFSKIDRRSVTNANLYSKVAQSANTSTLIVSDKLPARYIKTIPRRKLDAIIMFRSPYGVMASERRRNESTLGSSLVQYRKFHGTVLAWCRAFSRSTTIVSYERLVQYPQEMLNAICDKLELERVTIPKNLHNIDYHHIRGSRTAGGTSTVSEDLLWKSILTKDQIRTIADCHDVWRSYTILTALSLRPAEVEGPLKPGWAYHADGLAVIES
jgi:hypothetical protein